MGLLRRKDAASREPGLELYYASDIHGSDVCWRKFLGAARFYGLHHLVMGGDLIGKAVVPIERHADGLHSWRFLGAQHVTSDEQELEQGIEAIRFNGFYPWIGSSEELQSYANGGQDQLFDRVVKEDLARWIALAVERLGGDGTQIFVIAGNDDPWYVDEMLDAAEAVEFCDDRVVRVGDHEMISCSYANPTPWDSPRELDEEALYARIKALADQLEDPANAIFNLHVPPYDSGLDRATELKPDLTPRYSGGQPVEIPVGSHAVRQAIEEYQPLLALHGHIHESRGEAWIGRTLALNSGSEYNTGRLHGVIVKLARERVISHQFVVG